MPSTLDHAAVSPCNIRVQSITGALRPVGEVGVAATRAESVTLPPMALVTVVPDPQSIRQHVGTPLGPTAWLPVTQEMIDRFAEATGDRQWIHVDRERSKRESPFQSTVAHGFLTLALIPRLVEEIFVVENVALTVNAGLRRVKLSVPIPAESRIRLHAEVTDVRELSGGSMRVAIEVRMELEGDPKPACVAETLFVYHPAASVS